jgi:hypothetical protein
LTRFDMNREHVLSAAVLDGVTTALARSKTWLAYNTISYFLDKEDVHFFKTEHEAGEFAFENNSSTEVYRVIHIVSILDLYEQIKYGLHLESLINNSKNNFMNEQNFQYLKDNIKYLGFGENLDEALKAKLGQGLADFSIAYKAEINRKPFEAALHFRKSDSSDLYFLNSYSASLQRSNGEKVEQNFYLNKGKGVTAKEAYNLLEGRSVFKELSNKEGESYKAWIQIDFSSKDKNNNHELKQFHEHYGYDLKAAVSRFAVAELKDPDKEKALMQSLQKGNVQSITIEKDGSAPRMFIEANPQYKTVNLYDAQMKRVQKEDIGMYQSVMPSSETVKKEEQSQKQDQSKNKKQNLKNGVELPGQSKGRSRKKSMGM